MKPVRSLSGTRSRVVTMRLLSVLPPKQEPRLCRLAFLRLGVAALAGVAGGDDAARQLLHPRIARGYFLGVAEVEHGRALRRALGPVGVADCDVFVGAEGPTVLELNPRFGNAYPFAHVAGADLPAAVVAWARGDLPEPGWLRAEPGVTAARYSRLMLTSPG